jgi:small subunit ribosomal protein S8
MHTDPIADMLTRIRNAQAARKSDLVLPYSKIKYKIAEVLKAEGWIKDAKVFPGSSSVDGARKKVRRNPRFDTIKLILKYDPTGQPVIKRITRISKPGRRVYAGSLELPKVLNDLGVAIISSPQGLMTNKQAKQKGVGGEIICEIY